MRDLARHQELQCVDGSRIISKVNQPFVNDFGTSLGGDVAAQIDVEFASDFYIVSCSGAAGRIVKVDAAAAADGDQRIGVRRFAALFHRL